MDEQTTQPEVAEETQVQETEPSNIAEAFKLISRTNKEVPASDVSAPDSGGEAGTSDSEPEDSSDAMVPTGGQEQNEIPAADGDAGGLANQSEEYDYSAPRNKVLENIKSQALAETKKMFSDEGIDVVNGLTLNDLIERPVDRNGEPTGEVLFKDPDHPGKYISRNDARAWINDYNADVKAEFNRIANEKYNELMSMSRKERADSGEEQFPQEPIRKRFLISDVTPEGLSLIHAQNKRGLCLWADELSAWFKNFNRYNNGSEEQFWLSVFSAKTTALPISGPAKLVGKITANCRKVVRKITMGI